MHLSRRNFIRLLSYSIITIIALAIFGTYNFMARQTYARYVANSYQRGFAELTSQMTNIDTTLQKGAYASTPAQFVALSSAVWRDTGAAKNSLSNLPIYDANLQKMNLFLSQAGEYSYYLAKKVLNGETVTDADKANLKKLSATASSLSKYLNNLQNEVNDGVVTLSEVKYTLFKRNQQGQTDKDVTTFAGNMAQAEEQINDYPQLLYDGPFSDHIEKMKPVFLEGKKVVTREQARAIAADFLGVPVTSVKTAEEAGDKIPTFGFSSADITISITKTGGYIYEMTDTRKVTSAKLSIKDAISKARIYLDKFGFKNMRESYYVSENNVLTVNFAPVQDNVTLYPDLVKVSVALDNGKLTGISTNGYIMAHTDKRDLKATITEAAARAKVSRDLKVSSSHLTVIPTDGENEKLCYEFRCTSADNKTFLVYINAKTAREEKIMIVVETEGGVLTM